MENNINQFRPGYIKFECHASMLFSINCFSGSFERDRIQLKDVPIKLKDEEAEIEMTGSHIKEEAPGTNTSNMAEIKTDD